MRRSESLEISSPLPCFQTCLHNSDCGFIETTSRETFRRRGEVFQHSLFTNFLGTNS
jgi:hypothetical protein